ncbi:MAG: AraC family transcriptional regulator [Acidobacteriaceae bacterium]|nr:AraC family transcriptional regulator [Acidobacteriaceae bacterium]
MVHRLYTPPAPLRRLVKCLWYWEGAPQTHAKEQLMPNGEAAIIFNLRDEPMRIYEPRDLLQSKTFGFAVLSGPRSRPFVIDTAQEDRVFGIEFQPGGSFPFFRVPTSEFSDSEVSLECLWRSSVNEIRERLLGAPDLDSMFSAAESILIRLAVRPFELHPGVAFALHHFCSRPQTTVSSVRDRLGLSHRRFIQLFENQVGLTPKSFSRVQRFQRVLHKVHGAPSIDWAGVALDCGYYDQAHFIHDFQEFSGFTPTVYAARVTEHLNHVPLI